MKRNHFNTKSLINELNTTAKYFKRNSLFEDYGMNPNQQDQEQYMSGEEDMPAEEMGMEEEPQVDEQTVDVINQIRELAIQGIAQFANDVESEQYQALKKIWLLTDKFYEGMNEDEEKSKKF